MYGNNNSNVNFATGEIMKNRVKQMLEQGKVTIGGWISIAHADCAEIMANAGFDWIVFDMEHCPLTIQDVENLIPAVKGTNCVPIIRVAWNDAVLIKLALDVGAYGVIVPFVNTKQDALNAIKACRYPPNGVRGVYPRRASNYFIELEEYIASADEETMVIPQIETNEAVMNIEEILSVKGISAFLIGPMDLSASLGLIRTGPTHPRFTEAIDRILHAGRKAKVPAGIWGGSVEKTSNYIDQGFQFIALCADTDLLLRARDDLANIRKQLESRGRSSER